jgi:hypothetical protein
MLTRLKLTRGEGQLVEPSSYPTRRKQFRSPQIAERHSPSMADAEDHERVPDEGEDLRQTLMQMRDMMKVMMGYMMSQGEGSNPSMHKGGGGDKNPGRNGGNGASPPPSPPPSSSPHLLLLLLQVRRIFPILQRGMVKLLRKFLL